MDALKKIGWIRYFKGNQSFCFGVQKLKVVGKKVLTLTICIFGVTIKWIANQRMSNRLSVDTDLVSASCFKATFDE